MVRFLLAIHFANKKEVRDDKATFKTDDYDHCYTDEAALKILNAVINIKFEGDYSTVNLLEAAKFIEKNLIGFVPAGSTSCVHEGINYFFKPSDDDK